MSKKWYQSKTIIANVLMAAGVLIQAISGTDWLDSEAQAAIIVVVNLILRFVTNQGLST